MKTRLITRSLGQVAVAAALAIVALGSPALAQQMPSNDPKAVKAGTYKVEPYHTQVVFSLSHFGFSDFSGFFSGASGVLEIDPAKVGIAKLEVTLPIDSVLTTAPPLNQQLKGEQWFDTAKFPTASFKSTKVTSTGKDTASVAGELTLHGVTKPVVLQARLIGSGVNPLDKTVTVGFEATGVIKRSEFGISTYVPMVGDSVSLKIAGAFVLQP